MVKEEKDGMRNKNILLGVTGSIAVYKGVYLVREIMKKGAKVRVVMSQNAQHFVTPLTFSVVSQQEVFTDMFASRQDHLSHINLGRDSDLVLIAPATANFIAKLALGIADDLLSSVVLACNKPIFIAPAMNSNMLEKPVVQDNLKKITQRGMFVLETEKGELACGEKGKGRFLSLDKIVEKLENFFYSQQKLKGKNYLVTAGGTKEYIDLIRYIGNDATGKFGQEIAQRLAEFGAQVFLITTSKEDFPLNSNVEVIKVKSALDMKKKVFEKLPQIDGLFMSAAVSDFRPEQKVSHKVKKREKGLKWNLELVRNPDILNEIKKYRKKRAEELLVVGFTACSQDLEKEAKAKLKEKNLDYIIANKVPESFGRGNKKVILFSKKGNKKVFKGTKKEIAPLLLKEILFKNEF